MGLGGSPATVEIAVCETCTPAAAVPAERWGELEPRSILGDTTDYAFDFEPDCNQPFWFDLDVEDGYLYTVNGNGLEIYNTNVNREAPPNLVRFCRPRLGLFKKTDQDFYYLSVDASPGPPDVVGVGLTGGMGFEIFDASTPNVPVLKYQDEGRLSAGVTPFLNVADVQVLTLGSTHYAFVVSFSGPILIYDMSAAKALTEPCHEGTQNGDIACPGVYAGLLKRRDGTLILTPQIDGTHDYLLVDARASGVEIYDVTNPLFIELVARGGPGFPLSLAMWRQSSILYVAVARGEEVLVYSISDPAACIDAGGCTLETPLSLATPGGATAGEVAPTNRLTASLDGERAFLYAGSDTVNAGGGQREYLFDFRDPDHPREITPKSHPDGYWGWYYFLSPTGFNHVRPLRAKVSAGHVYRTAWSILDVHAISPTVLFHDGFDSGNLLPWSMVVTP